MKNQNWSLIVALSIPLLMIVLIAGSIYIPPMFAPKPAYDFVYTTGNIYYSPQPYEVSGGKLVYQPPSEEDVAKGRQPDQRLFFHDVETNMSKEITYEEASAWTYDSNAISPDGYEVIYGSNGGSFFFFGGYSNDYDTRYLTGHGASHKLNLSLADRNAYNMRVLGWIVD